MRTLGCLRSLVSVVRRNGVLLGFFAPLAFSALAQTQTLKVLGEPGQLLSGCPVEMAARQHAATALREVPGAFSGSMQGPRQGLTLTLKGRSPLRITGAEIVVHGLSASLRAVAIAGRADGEVSKTFHLANMTASELRSDVWMTGVSALCWIEVKSITYSDGSEWRESSGAKCGIAPDPLVLLSAR